MAENFHRQPKHSNNSEGECYCHPQYQYLHLPQLYWRQHPKYYFLDNYVNRCWNFAICLWELVYRKDIKTFIVKLRNCWNILVVDHRHTSNYNKTLYIPSALPNVWTELFPEICMISNSSRPKDRKISWNKGVIWIYNQILWG